MYGNACNYHNNPKSKCGYVYFIGEAKSKEMLSSLTKFTPLVRGQAGSNICSLAPSPYSHHNVQPPKLLHVF